MFTRHAVVAAFVMWSHVAFAGETNDWDRAFAQAIAYRDQGQLDLSIGLLDQSIRTAGTEHDRKRATGELGASLLQARRLGEAEKYLNDAYSFFSGTERARYAIDLGNLAAARNDDKRAESYYEEALRIGTADPQIHATSGLNLARRARLVPVAEKLKKLGSLSEEIAQIEHAGARARFYLNLGTQARMLAKDARELGEAAVEQQASALAYRSLEQARELSTPAASVRLHVESLDALAQLYEDHDRRREALILIQKAAGEARAVRSGTLGDLLINLEWRQGRLYRSSGAREAALAAYQRAVEQIESIRQDIPIEDQEGRSTFQTTLEPIYMGYVEELLEAAGKRGMAGADYLRRATNTIELSRQAEMQDYLGDRCAVDAAKGGTETRIGLGTAVLYPVILPDRIELLLLTDSEIVRRTVRKPASVVNDTIETLARALRRVKSEDYKLHSQDLYEWFLRPLEESFAALNIKTLLVVPDSALRLVPMAVLHDGSEFAIQKLAIATIAGLSMTNTGPAARGAPGFLIAGVSKPDAAAADRTGASKPQPGPITPGRKAVSTSRGLPGVEEEVRALAQISRSTVMLNERFTLETFKDAAGSGSYRLVHIASHGVFGDSGSSTYVRTYDGVLTLDDLQSLLGEDQVRRNPIELLTLSACETAEGDHRAPLGMSGAAIKARTKAVLGTLWLLADVAAPPAMETFYRGFLEGRLSKAEALRQSQIELIKSTKYAHPFFWAPFVLIGNWL